MKTIILTLVLFFLHLTNIPAQWEIINDGSDLKGYLNTIDFIDENVGWIGGQGTLLKTTDGGVNWNTIIISDSISYKHIDFITGSTGWAICGDYWVPSGSINKSIDGGFSWISQSPNFGFTSLYAIDENIVYAVGGDTIFKTTNGGINWIDISPDLPDRNYNSVWFQDSQTGVVVGNFDDGTIKKGIILKTSNGGTNWNVTTVNEFNNIYDLQFLDNNNIYFGADTDSIGFLCKTTDMFATWNVLTQVYAPHSQHYNPIKSFHFLNNNTAYAIMDDSLSFGNVMKSIDGGNNWNKIAPGAKGLPISKIYFNKTNAGIILSASFWTWGAGDYSFPALFSTEDYGFSWEIKKFSVPLTDPSFFHINQGFITGGVRRWQHFNGMGVVFSTSDQGNSLSIKHYHQSPSPNCIMTNYSSGFILTGIGILKTTDFGNNWFVVYSDNYDSLGYFFEGNEISFLNEQTGFAVGEYQETGTGGGVLFTTNGGDNWELGWKFPDTTINNYIYHYGLRSLCFTSTNGWAVGWSGIVVKYTPQTGWVQQPFITDLPLNKVFFSDENHGWIAGGYRSNDFPKVLLRTTNGGVNWITVPNVPYLFRDIAFIDNNLGWAIGYDSSGIGGILKTTNGGLNWEINTGNLPAKLNALHIKGNYGWAVGDNGLILRTTETGGVGVEDENDNSLSTEFVLYQNYPNPFNPSTVIGYRLPVISKVTLKVYDLLGREVATLVNEEQPAGSYEVQLTINDEPLTSGIYLYRLTTGSYTSTKKMLLLK